MKYASLIAACLFITPVFANDDDNTGMLFKGLLSGAGLISDGKPEIKYRERAPLVLPPSSKSGQIALPAPATSASAANAQWPKDADLEQKKPKPKVANRSGNKLTLEEMAAGRVADKPYDPTRDPTKNPAFDNRGSLFSMDNLTGKNRDKIDFKGEGERTSLIQPPSGYRTPSKNQPYGPVGQTDYSVKAYDPFDKSTHKN